MGAGTGPRVALFRPPSDWVGDSRWWNEDEQPSATIENLWAGDWPGLAFLANEDGVVPGAIAAASNAVGGGDKTGRAQPGLEGPLSAHRPYGKRTVRPQ